MMKQLAKILTYSLYGIGGFLVILAIATAIRLAGLKKRAEYSPQQLQSYIYLRKAEKAEPMASSFMEPSEFVESKQVKISLKPQQKKPSFTPVDITTPARYIPYRSFHQPPAPSETKRVILSTSPRFSKPSEEPFSSKKEEVERHPYPDFERPQPGIEGEPVELHSRPEPVEELPIMEASKML